MAEEPDNIVLRLLREIRSAQQTQGDVLNQHTAVLDQHTAVLNQHTAVLGQHTGALSRLERRVEDLYTMSTHTLGVAVSAHEKHLALEARLDQLSDRVERLESKA